MGRVDNFSNCVFRSLTVFWVVVTIVVICCISFACPVTSVARDLESNCNDESALRISCLRDVSEVNQVAASLHIPELALVIQDIVC